MVDFFSENHQKPIDNRFCGQNEEMMCVKMIKFRWTSKQNHAGHTPCNIDSSPTLGFEFLETRTTAAKRLSDLKT